MTVESTVTPPDTLQDPRSHSLHTAQGESSQSGIGAGPQSDGETRGQHSEPHATLSNNPRLNEAISQLHFAATSNNQIDVSTIAGRIRDTHQHMNGERCLGDGHIEIQDVARLPIRRRTQTGENDTDPSSSSSAARSGSKRHLQSRKSTSSNRKQTSSKMRKIIPQEMQAQWRVGAAPSIALSLSREDKQTARVLQQAEAYHKSMFDAIWGPNVVVNSFIYDLDNRIEIFRDSSVSATCLVGVGKSSSAQAILNRVLPSIDDLLRNPPPALYLILAEFSLGLVKTPNDALRDQLVRYVATRAFEILGPEHPITELLTIRVSQASKECLGDQLWRSILPILADSFGPDHYQSSTQVFCYARNMASCGRFDDAITTLETQIARWSELYGNNSMIVCYSKIELANVLIAADLGMKAEFVVSDAFRTTDMIHAAELRNEDCNVSEKRHREASIAFPRIAALRTLGKVHNLRGNIGAAIYHYSQAVDIGRPSLGPTNAAVELALSDLESARNLESRRNLQTFSVADLSKLTHIVPSPVSS